MTWITVLFNSMKLWAMRCRATQEGQVMMESSDKTWSTGEGNGKPLRYTCLENPMNNMKRKQYGHPQKSKNRAATWSSNYTPKHISRQNYNLKRYMYIAALFTVAKTKKQPKCPSTDEWINVGNTYTVEYYSVIKRKETMPPAATRMDPRIILLSEVSQKDKCPMISLIVKLLSRVRLFATPWTVAY